MLTNEKKKTVTDQFTSSAELEGIDHINIDKSSKTELGALLANFPRTPFKHPVYGPFISLEGFWHWIRTKPEKRDDHIRSLYGFRAKAYGRKTSKSTYIPNFKEEIILAIYHKVVQNERLYDLLVESTLPFKQYYVYGPKNIEISPDSSKWQCDGVEQIRKHLKEHGKEVPFQYQS